MKIWLVRHGMTQENKEKKYIGITNVPLCPEGLEALHPKKVAVEAVFCSPLIRCRQTAKALFPDHDAVALAELRELSFGPFENKSPEDLAGNPDYEAWAAANFESDIPGAPETAEEFVNRSVKGLEIVLGKCYIAGMKEVAIVAHGGTLMSIMYQLTDDERGFYDWQVPNGMGYLLDADFQDDGPVIHHWKLLEDVEEWN